jgi:NADPH-dependent ferric siderophore reductase
MTFFNSSRRVERVRHELLMRDVTVTRIDRLSPGFLAITFTGDTLASFVSLSFDDHVKLMVPDSTGQVQRRDFTPRSFDLQRRELTLEFALHDHGPACQWARAAKVGDKAVIGGPRGSMIIPKDYDWHLLAGDASALPAIHSRLEELPAGSNVLVIAHVDTAADQRVFKTQANVALQWVYSASDFVQAVRDLTLPKGDGFAWSAGEASVIAQVRDVLLNDKHVPLEATRISAYWKHGAADYHQREGRPG